MSPTYSSVPALPHTLRDIEERAGSELRQQALLHRRKLLLWIAPARIRRGRAQQPQRSHPTWTIGCSNSRERSWSNTPLSCSALRAAYGSVVIVPAQPRPAKYDLSAHRSDWLADSPALP